MPKGLVPIRLPLPGSWGLNTQRRADILPAQWATVADNCVFDDSNRLSSRKGTQRVNATAISASPDVDSMHEYIDGVGGSAIILAAGSKIYRVSGSALTDITGTITTPTGDNWKFVNFNGNCVGLQAGHTPIVVTSVAGSFANITLSGTNAPTTTAGDLVAAYGRLWCVDGTDLKYSSLLSYADWTTASGAGTFDLSTVWLEGMDEAVAVREFNGHLVIFGKNNIVIYNNPWVPTGGGDIDEATMSLVEQLGGVGCIARDSVRYTGDEADIVFLSSTGVRTLARTIQEKSMPVGNVSKNVTDEFLRLAFNEAGEDIKAVYSPADGFYLISLPSINTSFYFDMRQRLEDGSYRTTKWNYSFTSALASQAHDIYLGSAGYLSKYTGYLDDKNSDGTGGSSYSIEYLSGWNDLGQVDPQIAALVKIPKKGNFLFLGGSGQTVNLKWGFDFEDTFQVASKAISSSNLSEWGIAEWGLGEWSGGASFNRIKAPLNKSGQVLKFGVSTTVSGGQTALQDFEMLIKLGRISG